MTAEEIDFYTLDADKVVDGYFISGKANYQYALDHFHPLIGRLDIQRDPLKTKFYTRLEEDIVLGCIMPPITVALVQSEKLPENRETLFNYIKKNINNCFILDGIQRLNTLKRAASKEGFDPNRPIFFNFIIAGSRDRLLYRMITLNNGQKPMSARHQIDILADAFFEFKEIPLKLISEKGNGRVRAPDTFKKADFVKGYIAYLSGSVNIDNQKIIEEKMDELVASKIIESDISSRKIEFSDVVEFINRISEDQELRDWIRNQNNFIGLCAGSRETIESIKSEPIDNLKQSILVFEKAFDSINVSKVNLGKVRRELVSRYINNYETLKNIEEFDLLEKFMEWI